MASSGGVRSRLAARGWPVADAPANFLGYLLLVDVVAALYVAHAVVASGFGLDGLGNCLLLTAIAIGFEEGGSRAARLQIRLSSSLRCDMTSVWAVAAAVALRPAWAVLFLVSLSVYIWFRHHRPAGEALYRKIFVAWTMLAGSMLAGAAAVGVRDALDTGPTTLGGTVSVLTAIVVYTLVNRVLVSIGLLIMSAPVKALLGSRHDNLVELATLCLGGLVALALLHEPWLALLVVAPMVTLQRGALVSELEAAAITDAKTGLLNAVAWEQLAQREIRRAERQSQDVTVLIIDIDRFKAVNDRFGHLIGDDVLRRVGRTLTESLREFDGVGRFGGEEFVAVLPDTGESGGLVIAERVRSRINQLSLLDIVTSSKQPGANLFAADAGGEALSVSIGVAILRRDGDELSELLHAADQALYRAKGNGRNQVQLAGGGGELPERIST